MSGEQKLREYLKKATGELQVATRRLREAEQREREPIAIVGMSCRFPGGASSPGRLWELLARGEESTGKFPENRGWDLDGLYDPDPDRPGHTHARAGSFLEEPAGFDSDFFGISPREALAMDPQQRLLLEAAWEALEDAGIDPAELRGTDGGVFAGVMHHDYVDPGKASANPQIEGHLGTGTAASVASGRIAYELGLEGPAVTVDTACSSSLVAMHLAAQALRAGECGLALAGGVTVLATPGVYIEMSRQRAIAPDGRCKSFSADADGTGWSEGSGLLLLERLSDAQRNGRRILAVIKGSATNQDGASNGLTAPNGPSQERVIRQALANAGLKPSEVDAVEAHGTGTTLGDPIEAGALLATYGQERDTPLQLGSLKSNIGHTQAAAGVGGVIKMVMALREEALPKTLHVSEPTPHVDWSAGEIELLTEQRPWPRGERPRRAGVSSFGISGTNAHLIIEEAPEQPAPEKTNEAPPLLPYALSAKTPEALNDAAARLAGHLEAAGPEALDVAHTLLNARAQLEQRALIVAGDEAELLQGLDALAQSKPAENLTTAKAATHTKTVFCFPGQGSQWLGMASELLDESPLFAEQIARCEQALAPYLETPLSELLRSTDEQWLSRVELVQPALFAVMVALAELWRSYGVEPAAVVGHSQGEIAAAVVAGALSLEDGAKLAALRARSLVSLMGAGEMASVQASAEEAEPHLKPYADRVSIAAHNGPRATVLSGEPEAIAELIERFEAEGTRARLIPVGYASHCAQIEAIEEELKEAIGTIEAQDSAIPFYSTLSGEPIQTSSLDADYWYRNLREPVRFRQATERLIQDGHSAFVEVSAHPVLALALSETAEAQGKDSTAILHTLRREEGDSRRMLTSLADAHVQGVDVDFDPLFEGTGAALTELPTYPFQRRRYWLEASRGSGDASSLGQSSTEHPLLAASVPLADGSQLLTGRISPATHPWLAEHAVAGTAILPGTAFVELALRAGQEVGATHLQELILEAPLPIPGEGAVQLQVTVSEDGEEHRVEIHARPEPSDDDEEAPWSRHASATISDEAPTPLAFDAGAWPPAGAEPIATEDLYERVADLGLDYGPAFQGLEAAWKLGEEIYAEVSLAEEQTSEAGSYGVHPALLDAALHPAFLLAEVDAPRLPFAFNGVALYASEGASALRVKVTAEGEKLRLEAADAEGNPVASISALATREIDPAQLGSTQAQAQSDALLGVEWTVLELPEGGGEAEEVDLFHCVADPSLNPASASRALAAGVLAELQERIASDADFPLAFLTEGAVALDPSESPDPALAAVWGLVRSAQSEHPGRFVLVDSDGSEASERALAAVAQTGEPQLALRDGIARAPRLSRASEAEQLVTPTEPWRVMAGAGGTIESLAAVPSEGMRPLVPGEVRIAIHAAGINFRDVLIALGMYPGAAAIGGEGAGVVLEVGPGVEGLGVGDRVLGLIPDAFGPVAISHASVLRRLPKSWSFEQGAAVSVVSATAYYGLVDLGELKAGERVLVHAGAGGVGMAAIQLAQHLGAEVFATASPGKWGTLRGLGLDDDHIASSRDLEFKDKFLEVTEGEGVDVVLDSLAREFVDASLELLPRGGRFLEMGKTDVRDAGQVAANHPGVVYRAFDLAEAGPERSGEILGELLDLFEQGAIQHPPIAAWDIRDARAAFRHLSQARHVGKLVFTIPQSHDPDGTVLVTGGLSGLGALTARHLAGQGARHLLLTSRRGPESPGTQELIAELADLGCEAEAIACDVAEKDQVEALVDSVPARHPLTAVVHSAGALDDATIESLDPDRLDSVFAPKADGAWNLHEATKDLDLAAFVLFSSAAATLGSPGQGNYAAANAFLDGLAQLRRAEGLPATSIAWGMWEQESELVEDSDRARLGRLGLAPLSPSQGLELFDRACGKAAPLAVALPLQVSALRSAATAGLLPPLFSGLVKGGARRSRAASGSLARRLATVARDERQAIVLSLVREHAATVLGHSSAEAIDPKASFKDLGFDSLGAVELRNRLAQATGVKLEATVVFDYPTAEAAAGYLLSQVEGTSGKDVVVHAARGSDEPIAIVGMSCRFPGDASSPQALWEMLASGGDGISPFPTDRGWDLDALYDPDPDRAGKVYARTGGFLSEATEFDPAFFGISPREALAMDPQQRLLLEGAWEALEDAGIDPAAVRGSATGVFAGVIAGDYLTGAGAEAASDLEGHAFTGVPTSVASGRISYALGLEGPAMTIDTACSSSLVAMHLAAAALRGGECELALAGGVTVIARPGTFVMTSRQRALSPDGRCKSFSAEADGAGFSEGSGLLLLERLSDAERNGRRILAVIRGSATNQDGASNGLTAPNGPSQERVIRQALANAGLKPSEVDAVEAHGTGTTLGDPIEAGALLATYGQERETPLQLGSLKSNIGHTQAAAGVGGVIKMVMALREEALPKTLHVNEPTPHVDWSAGEIELLTEQRPWPKGEKPRRAGISSFGISGTNAHLIIEEAPEQPAPEKTKETPPLLPFALSAKSPEALSDAAGRLAAHIEAKGPDPLNVAHTLLNARAQLEQRAAIVASGGDELLAGLDALAQGKPAESLVQAKASAHTKTVFCFPGQGSQWLGMAADLLEESPLFAAQIARCEQALAPYLDTPLTELLRSEDEQWLSQVELVQPALFAVMVALAELWRAYGVEPAAVIGHSQGEIAAAVIAGALTLEDGAKLAALRAKSLMGLMGKGEMASVQAGAEEVEPELKPYADRVSIAAQNGPRATVLSGEPEAIAELIEHFEAEGIRARLIPVGYASHCAQIEAIEEELKEAIGTLEAQDSAIPFYSTLSGEPLDTSKLDADYWYRNLREPVCFRQATERLLQDGHSAFVEVSAHPVLALALSETAEAQGKDSTAILHTLRREEGDSRRMLTSLAAAHAHGIGVDFAPLFEGASAALTELPTYPFQRRRYWLEASRGRGDASSLGQSSTEHPLLGASIEMPEEGSYLFTSRLSLREQEWLADHVVAGTSILPATAFVELALSAGREVGAGELSELLLEAPLALPAEGAVQLRLGLIPADDEGAYELAIHARPEPEPGEEAAPFARHASGLLTATIVAPESFAAVEWPPSGAEPLAVEGLYERLADIGLEYGPAFQGLEAAWKLGEEIYAEVSLAPDQAEGATRFGIHPALLDAALHPALLGVEGDGTMRLPFSFAGVSLHGVEGPAALRVRVVVEGEKVSLRVADREGNPVAGVAAISARQVDPAQLGASAPAGDALFGLQWSEVELPDGGEVEAVEVFECVADPAKGAREMCAKVLERLQAAIAGGTDCLAFLTEGAVAIDPSESPDPALAAVWGLVRSAQSEHPGRFVLVDTDGSEASGEALAGALRIAEESQLALREGVARVPRLAKAADSEELELPRESWCLQQGADGTLESLAAVPSEATRELGDAEVRIAVHAAGLNFRDVLIALGMYPGAAAIGGEGAGVVLETGPLVEGLKAGDRVLGLIPDAFGPVAISHASVLRRMPESWSFEQGAAVSVVSATAYFGLVDLGELKAGERVLIHAGAGGVGMAAIQLAQHLGAEVFATASPGKWETLRGLGLDDDHIASSRDLEFRDKFLEVTGGEGMDVVLDSLAREFVDASLDLLPRGGRFLEMGRTDVRDADRVAADHPGVAYRAFNLAEAGPQRSGEIIGELLSLFGQGAIQHSPIAAWDVRDAKAAFRHLSQARHVGKLVLTIPQAPDPEGTVLITGGLSGLGALTAKHLAENGAKHLLLTSRRGSDAPGATELIAELAELGCEAEAVACDVSDQEQVEKLVAGVSKDHPLTAVVHSAGALDDATIESLDASHLDTVFAPKADGAWNLHEATKGMELAAFVFFSSAAATLGSPGQGNYAAANSFLDALAAKRRAEGLPGTSIAWGMWAQESELVEDSDRERLGRLGLAPLSPSQGLELFDRATAKAAPLAVALPLRVSALRSAATAGLLPQLFSGLIKGGARRSRAASGSLARHLAEVPAAEREAIVLALVREHAATVLGHSSAEAIDPKASFKDLGFDSLGAVELRNRLAQATGVRLEATVVFDYPTAEAAAGYLLSQVEGTSGGEVVVHAARGSEEPIAIVGMSCRFPGDASSPQQLWELLASGGDGIAPFPTDRGWDLESLYDPDPDRAGKIYAKTGGFLAEATEFDPGFFGISPREALAMDPQQRLLLEGAWEALEDAGIDPAAVRGSATGVFAGVIMHDYADRNTATSHPELEGHLGTGAAGSVASGRVAYELGLEGPAMTVDTACSSSLIAMHLAAQALRGGECDLALAGGVTTLASPSLFVGMARQRGLAPDGRCKSFSAEADGAGFSEGSGLLLLERLSDAQRNGRRILAVIKGSATNQDGASNGLTAPNGPSQERVIRQALANAGLKPSEVDAVEAHGTGTTLGDPIEAGALLATYGQERETPLQLGSLKSNIGHTQAAAGVGGVIKMVMALREEALPRTLHVSEPTPHVDWSAGEIELLTEEREWPKGERPRRAGISSFGISGTNAHLIIEEAPEQPAPEKATEAPPLLPFALSARTPEALADAAGRLAAHLEAKGPDSLDVAHTLLRARAQLEQRAVIVAADQAELLAGLDALAQGRPAENLTTVRASTHAKTVFCFPGQGSQWLGMAADLLDESPLFAEQIARCEQALAPYLETPLTELLRLEDEEWLSRVELVQPALFAVMVALAELWRSYGVEPAAVVGHSQGEIAAAVVAGALTLEDGAKLAALRAKSLVSLMGAGEMASVQASAEEVEPHLDHYTDRVSIAAHNGPRATVLSGEPEAIEELIERFEAEGTRARLIPVGYASHCAQIEAIEEELKEAIGTLEAQDSAIPFYSTLSGEPLDTSKLDADYWYRNLREPVCFRQATERLLQDGHSAFVEVSAHPVLALALSETAEAQGKDATAILHTLRREEGGSRRMLTSLAAAHAHGIGVDFDPLFEGTGATLTELPTYPFQRRRYWLEASRGSGDASSLGQSSTEHPLLGASVALADGSQLLTGRISQATHPWLAEHAVAGTAILPGTAFVELALRAGVEVGATHLQELILEAPLPIPGEGAVHLQVTVSEDGEEHRVEIHARPEPTADQDEETLWARHASATLSDEAPAPLGFDAGAWPPAGAEPIATEDLYERVADTGLEYGPAFQGLEAAWKLGGETYAEVSLASEQEGEAARYGIHPALLDAALHPAFLDADPSQSVRLPFSFAGVSLHEGEGASALRVKVTAEGEKLRLEAADAAGNPVVSIAALATREIDPAQLGSNQAQGQGDDLFEIKWNELKLPEGGEEGEEVHVHRLAVDPSLDPAAAAHTLTAEVLNRLQEAIADEGTSRLAFVTTGAVALDPSESPAPALAAIWGLVRSAQSEHPGRFLLIDTDGSDVSERALAAALAQAEEPQLALRDGVARVPRLQRAPDSEEQAPSLDPEGTVLITGGLSGLGALTARHLAEQGSKHLLLSSRRGPEAPGATELIAELTALGCEAEAIACDVSDKEQVEKLVAGIAEDHPLTALIHSAGALDDGVIESLDPSRLDAVLAPKADAAWHLHEATAEMDLAAFVLFSSAAASFGSPGQGNYAAANSFLDALAIARRAEGLAATSVAWGMWEQESDLVAGADRERLGRLGMAPIAVEQGLEMLDWARRRTRPLVIAAPLRISALRAAATAGMLPPLFSGLVQVRRRRSQSAASFARRLAAVPEAEREAFALAIVREHAAAVLGHASPDDVDPAANFKDLGFDSLGAVELRNRLVGATGARLEATLVFDRPTPEAIAAYLLEQVTPGAGPAVDPAEAELRRLLTAIPVARLREAGVLDTLRALEANQAAGPDAEGSEGDALESIDEMDIDQLVRQTLEPETAEG